MSINRRVFLRSAMQSLAALSVAGAAGCRQRQVPLATPPPLTTLSGRALFPVLVSPDREIRTTVGLRPFRPSGFAVRAEKLDDTLVVHIYCHGGA